MYSKSSQLREDQEPELHNMRLLKGILVYLIIVLILMPQYFGIHLGYDLTCSRVADLLLLAYMLLCPMVMTIFWRSATRCAIFYPLMVYLFVAAYTMVLRVDPNAFFLVFLEVLTLFLMIFGIRYVLGYKKALRIIVNCAYFLSIYGFIEYICGKSLYLQFLCTMPTNVTNYYRSGHYRIMGPCGHSLGYGLLLLIFIAVISYDPDRDELYLFHKPLLLAMLLLNVFLTGSRSTLGIAGFECFLILLFSKGTSVKKTLLFSVILLISFLTMLFMLQNTGIGKYFMGQIMSIVDQFFGTSYAKRYGIDSTTLQNSTNYRKMLPYIFTLDWLNPIIGRGNKFHGAEIQGVYIHSIDNYYVSQFIKYAYPGLISYVLFILTAMTTLIHEICKYKSGLAKMVLIGTFCYFLNLWWLDALQTLKFVYLLLAVFFAYQQERKDREKRLLTREKEKSAQKKALGEAI